MQQHMPGDALVFDGKIFFLRQCRPTQELKQDCCNQNTMC